jgi:NO-binding membrane sensor protein with MHYT domain
MAEIHHLGHGWVTPTASYVLSVLGSLLGLTCAVRLRSSHSTAGRIWWLALAAVAIGGTGIWTMHFVAMLGFSVVGVPIRYDVGLTAASAIIAVAAVALGLAIATLGSSGRQVRILIGGVLAGLGVAAMHYTGMAAMRMDGHISYGGARVGMSIGIAVIAATVALWLAVTVQKPVAIFGSALIMGVAVNGMHFTGMSAMSVQHRASTGLPATGATATTLLIPIGLAVVFGILGLVYALMAAPTDEDRAGLAYMAARQNGETPLPRPEFTPRSAPAAPSEDRPTLGQALAATEPPPVDIPQQRGPLPRRMPSSGSSWTFRDRAEK